MEIGIKSAIALAPKITRVKTFHKRIVFLHFITTAKYHGWLRYFTNLIWNIFAISLDEEIWPDYLKDELKEDGPTIKTEVDKVVGSR